MNPIKKLWKLLVEDTKTDIKTIKEVVDNGGLNEEQRGRLKEFVKPGGINWTLFSFLVLFCLLTFVMGYMISGAYYTKQCNEFVQQEIARLQNWQGSRNFLGITETPPISIFNYQDQNEQRQQNDTDRENNLQPVGDE